MSAHRDDLRRAVGRALRSVRQGWQLSLEDVEQASLAAGVRITRSHLSRVENGEADLALPRFLALMRAVGLPPGAVADDLDALLDGEPGEAADLLRRADAAAAAREPAAAAPLYRLLARRVDGPLVPPVLDRWAGTEAALGRFEAAARVLRLALGPLPHPPACLALRLAAASLAAGQPGVAQPIARGAAHDAPEAAALLAAGCAVEAGGPLDLERLEAAAGAGGALGETAAILHAELLRRRGRARSALALAEQVRDRARDPVRGAEARLAAARAAGDVRRAAYGLREVDRARPLARASGVPDLVARCHAEASRLLRATDERDAARQAQRAARAIARRHAADAGAPAALPLHALLQVATAACPGAACPVHGSPP